MENNFRENRENEIVNFSHGPEFLNEALDYLKEHGMRPEWGKKYLFHPSKEGYESFFKFFLSELENLPFDNRVGESIEMRGDSKVVVQKLIEYLTKKSSDLSQTSEWNNEDLENITDIFNQGLEVFKNEIYPKHNTEGIGYNVDLSARFSKEENRYKPSAVILERRYITNKDGFRVLDHGFLTLDLQSGDLWADLEEWPTGNVHLGK